MTYTAEEMKAAWLSRRYRLPLRADCEISVTACADGPDYEAGIIDEINDWYNDLLTNGAEEYLDPEDIKGETTTKYYPESRSLEVTLPPGCRRIIRIRLKGNPRSVTMINVEDRRAELQQSAMSCGGYFDPIGLRTGNILLIYGSRGEEAPEVSSLTAVMEPREGFYRLHPSALGTIKEEN